MTPFKQWLNNYSYLILGALLLLFALLFYAMQGTESRKHAHYLDQLRELRIAEGAYNTEMLRVRFQAHSDFDELLTMKREIHHLLYQLENPPYYLGPHFRLAIQNLVRQISVQFDQKLKQSSHFQSARALYNNSIRYLPTIHEEIEHLAEAYPQIELFEGTYHLTEALLANLSDINKQGFEEEMLLSVEAYRQQLQQLSTISEQDHQTVHATLRHIEIVITTLPIFVAHLEEATSDEMLQTISRTREIYLSGYRVLQRRVQVATNLLTLFTLALFMVLLLAVFNLRRAHVELEQTNLGLEHRVNERTAALAESKEYAENITHSMSEALLVTDQDHHILSCNLAAEQLIGDREPALIGTALSQWVDLPECSGTFSGKEGILTNKSHQPIPVELSCTKLHTVEETQHRYTYLLHDLRHRRHAEQQQQFLAYQSGIAEMGVTVMHNIGNIITSLSGKVELARQGNDLILKIAKGVRLFPRQQELINNTPGQTHHSQPLENHQKTAEVMEKSGETIEQLCHDKVAAPLNGLLGDIQRIGDLIRLHQTKIDSEPVQSGFDLNALVTDVIALADSAIQQHQITTAIECDPMLTHLLLPRHLFQQMLTHLLQNSIESIAQRQMNDPAAPKGAITIQGRIMDNNQWNLQLIDNGKGIEQDKIEKLFGLGQSTKQGRSGYGLHAVGNFVQSQKGSIELQSEGVNQGASVSLTFPL